VVIGILLTESYECLLTVYYAFGNRADMDIASVMISANTKKI